MKNYLEMPNKFLKEEKAEINTNLAMLTGGIIVFGIFVTAIASIYAAAIEEGIETNQTIGKIFDGFDNETERYMKNL